MIGLPPDVGTSVLFGSWLDQAHKAGAIKILHDVATIVALHESKIQW